MLQGGGRQPERRRQAQRAAATVAALTALEGLIIAAINCTLTPRPLLSSNPSTPFPRPTQVSPKAMEGASQTSRHRLRLSVVRQVLRLLFGVVPKGWWAGFKVWGLGFGV